MSYITKDGKVVTVDGKPLQIPSEDFQEAREDGDQNLINKINEEAEARETADNALTEDLSSVKDDISDLKKTAGSGTVKSVNNNFPDSNGNVTVNSGTPEDYDEVVNDVSELKNELPGSAGFICGDDLLQKFGSATNFLTELRTGTSKKIHVGDYIKCYLNGTYYNWGAGKLPSGHPYYSDTALTAQAGTAASDLTVTYDFATYGHVTVSGTNYYVPIWDCVYPILTNGSKYYSDAEHTAEVGTTTRSYLCDLITSADDVTFDIDGTTYHAEVLNVHNSDKVTMNNAETYFEIAGINPYWRYGDSGDLTGNKQHLYLMMRDCLPTGLQMRRYDQVASWTASEYVGELTSTTTPNGSVKDFNFTKATSVTTPYVCGAFVNGIEVAASNVTVSGDTIKVTFSTAPATGATITCRYTSNNVVWMNTALYHTINDPDLGVLPCVVTALDTVDTTKSLSAGMYAGPNGNGMRYYADQRPGTMSGSSASGWVSRGKLFFPQETEVWGNPNFSALKDYYGYLPILPIFLSGRRRSKGYGNNGSRNYWCVGSPGGSSSGWCLVGSYGIAHISNARYTSGVALGFLLT